MGPAKRIALKNVLVIKDDLKVYSWLMPKSRPNSEVAVRSMTEWIAAFGSMDWLVRDRGLHFPSEVVRTLTHDARIRLHLSTAYYPWANGAMDRICNEVLKSARSQLSEWRLATTNWPDFICTLQLEINQAPLRRLGLEHNANGWRGLVEEFIG